jgi:hypothetical protein
VPRGSAVLRRGGREPLWDQSGPHIRDTSEAAQDCRNVTAAGRPLGYFTAAAPPAPAGLNWALHPHQVVPGRPAVTGLEGIPAHSACFRPRPPNASAVACETESCVIFFGQDPSFPKRELCFFAKPVLAKFSEELDVSPVNPRELKVSVRG